MLRAGAEIRSESRGGTRSDAARCVRHREVTRSINSSCIGDSSADDSANTSRHRTFAHVLWSQQPSLVWQQSSLWRPSATTAQSCVAAIFSLATLCHSLRGPVKGEFDKQDCSQEGQAERQGRQPESLAGSQAESQAGSQ